MLETAAVDERELRHSAVEEFIRAGVDEKIYIELPEEYQAFPGAMGKFNKAVYGLLQAVRLELEAHRLA